MAVAESVHVRTSLRNVLRDAGVGFEADQSSVHLDLSVLDGTRWAPKREQALLMTASLLFRLDDEIVISAKLPETLRSRRALAASGVMFALAQHHATFDDESVLTQNSVETLFDASPLRRLAAIDSWRDTYTPFDSEFRDLMIPSADFKAGALTAWSNRPRRGIGVFDDDFAAFVNPHRLPAGKELQAIASVASPWFAQLLAADRMDAEHVVGRAMEFLGHALDNVREHAFGDQTSARSLVTLGRVTVNETPMYRLQILDNGVGIPASLHEQLDDQSLLDVERSKDLLNRAVHGTEEDAEPLLPKGRNIGLPSMRELTGKLSGWLWIVTSGSGGSQITVTCDAERANPAFADLIPVAGTVVTLMVPLVPASDNAGDPEAPLLETLDL